MLTVNYELLKIEPGDRLLDLGCGGGRHAFEAARRGARVVATDLDRSELQQVSALDMPVFVANGDSDPMILPHYSYLLAGLIPQARVKIYPDSAHGFLFQHHAEFAADVDVFLAGAR